MSNIVPKEVNSFKMKELFRMFPINMQFSTYERNSFIPSFPFDELLDVTIEEHEN